MKTRNPLTRLVLTTAVTVALLGLTWPAPAGARPLPQSRTRTFPETGQTVSGRFLEVWEGGHDFATSLYLNGYPLTDRHPEVNFTDGKTYQTQWFERARYEAHPENTAPDDVLLGLLGVYAAEGRHDPPFRPVAARDCSAGVDYFTETRHCLNASFQAFFYKQGGVRQFGLPISESFRETAAAHPEKSYTVQYFERQRMELHPENGGTPYEVLLGRLGAEQINQVAEPPRTYAAVSSTPVDTIRVAVSAEPDTLFSATASVYVAGMVLVTVENSLVYGDDQGQWHGSLAAFVPTVDNGGAFYTGEGRDKRLVVKYKLKHGIKWSDGQPFDSNDVLMWYRINIDPTVQVTGRFALDKFASLDNPDPYTVIASFLSANEAAVRYQLDPERYAVLKSFADAGTPVTDPYYFQVLGAYPQHVLSKFEGHFDEIINSDFARAPIGTGPYMVTNWTPGVSIELTANPYYNVDPEPPRIKHILFKIITDPAQMIAQLQTGSLDATEGLSLNMIDALDQLKLMGITAYYTPGSGWEHADFNLDKIWFQDVRVRQAIAYAINRQGINKAILFGKGTLMDTYLPPLNWASMMNPAMIAKYGSKFPLTTYPYDPDKARQLLDAAGWQVGAEGIRVREGTRLAFHWMTTAANPGRAGIAQIVQQNLKAVGIEVTLEYMPSQQYFADDGPVYHRTGDVVEFAWSSSPDPSSFGLWHSSQIPSEANNWSGQNIPGWRNARADELILKADNALSQKEREPLYAEHQQLYSQELPSLPFFAQPRIAAAKTGLKNFRAAGTTLPITWNAQEWVLDK